MSHYWTKKHQGLIEQYYYAQFNTNSGITMNRCITELLPVLEHMIRLSLYTTGSITPNDENIQDVLVYLIDRVLPKLQERYLKGALQFLWISSKRYLINKRQALKLNIYPIDGVDVIGHSTDEADYIINKEDLRKQILDGLDDKIIEHQQINKNSTILLILMKEYLIQNDFNPEGFNVWVQKKMNIAPSTYAGIINRCGIRSKIFNQKIIEDKKNIEG